MIKLIKTDVEYETALKEAESLIELDPMPGTPEGDRLELLVFLISRYEDKKFPLDLPGPIDALKFRMEQQGLTANDLVQYLGSRSKVSEVLNGKRPLSLRMIRALYRGLGIPAEVLLQETDEAVVV